MLKIEVYNHEITEVEMEGNLIEVLTDLGTIVDHVIKKVARCENDDKEEVLDDLVTKIKEVWIESDEGEFEN